MFIDPHVHCRDGKQAYKETVAHALAIAERAGMTAIFDMPNTSPPIDSRNAAVERIALAEKADSPVFYGIYLGITADPAQIREAVAAYNELKNVIGFKMFARLHSRTQRASCTPAAVPARAGCPSCRQNGLRTS